MDTHSPRPDDLRELERRLSAWEPASAGLDPDALLFAAGRASVRPGPTRFVWPALTVCLAGLATVLGVCLKVEHAERLALVQQMRQPPPPPTPNPAPSAETSPGELLLSEEVPPSSLLASHRLLERGLDDWPSQFDAAPTETADPVLPRSPVLQVGNRDFLLGP